MSIAPTDARTAAGFRARMVNQAPVYAGCEHVAPTAATFTGPASMAPTRAAISTPLAHPTPTNASVHAPTSTGSRRAPACAAHGLTSSSSARKAAS
ncbi:hypothetical protein [Streptomyces turgidiscabies]|uniref:Uncharacterized protein n=1 Tax=Streptomyces turgidiscabies TaxID=85558 RepID=A0ABU0RWK7_9ACTN|nr:hypothetical protein [Streptomyces turgidiscabies]MDQ0936369.1 hypothetical protein [Streptomyces turgidiscabies]